MLRPFALVGFTYLLTLAAAVYFGASASMLIACVCLFCLLACLFIPRLQKAGIFPVAFCTMALAFGCFSAYSQEISAPGITWNGKDAVADFTLCELSYHSYNRTYYTAQIDAVNGKALEQSFRVRITSRSDLGVQPYDRLQARLHFSMPEGGDGFSSRTYYASKGISCFAYLYDNERVALLSPVRKPLYYYALILRKELLRSVHAMFPKKEAGFLCGVLFGDKSGLSEEISAQFRTIGLSHVLAVSGLHMSTITGLLLAVLKLIKVPRRFANAAAAVGILCFMAVTGFVPSATRSGIMYLLLLLGGTFSRRSDALNSLGLAVLLLCIHNPYAAADTGLLLSFCATLGLILLANPVCQWLDARVRGPEQIKIFFHGINSVLGTSIGATLFTLPILILSFHTVSPISLLANVLELWPATLMIQFGAIAAVLYLAFPWLPLFIPFSVAANALARYVLWCADKLSKLPYASLSAVYGFVALWLACLLVLLTGVLLMGGNKKVWQTAAALSVILLCIGTLTYQVSMRGVTRVAVLNTEGISAVVTRDFKTAVIGCGDRTSNTLSQYLQEQNIKQIAYLQPFSVSGKEGRNTAKLLKKYEVETIVLPKIYGSMDESLQGILPESANYHWFKKQSHTQIWDSFSACSAGGAVQLNIRGITILLCSKNLSVPALPEEWLNSDFVILQNVPKNIQQFNPYCTILSMQEDEASKAAKKVQDAVGTYDGSVVLEITPDGALKIRREE